MPGASRRAFLRFLAASPPFASSPLGAGDDLIGSAGDALDVFDFESVARRKLPPAHYGYLATDVDGDVTLRANREDRERIRIRVRRLVDVTSGRTGGTLCGAEWKSPIALAPVSSLRAFHPDGELAVTRAAREKERLFILSTLATASVKDVTAARGGPVWYQLYPIDEWAVAAALVKRAERAGCPVLVLTTDLQGGTNRLTERRLERQDAHRCESCHAGGSPATSETSRCSAASMSLASARCSPGTCRGISSAGGAISSR